MIHIVIFLLALVGFASLLIAITRHQQDWLHRKLPPLTVRILRLSGFAALVLAFAVAGGGLGWSYGVAVSFGWLTIASALVVTVNTNRERIMGRIRP